MNIFLSLAIIFVIGIVGGLFLEKIKIPKIIWYIILGVLIGPSVFNIVGDTLLSISAILRQIALVIILTRAGLSLNINDLKKIGRPAILMCFVPACFEIIGITIFSPLLLGISFVEALLLGSVLAAVSPAIVVPRMLKLMNEDYGNKHNVPDLIMAGASCDDIFVIVLFYSFKTLVATNSFEVLSIMQIPISIITGIILGIIVGLLLVMIINKVKIQNTFKVILMLGLSFAMIALETFIKPYFSISSLLAIIVMALVYAILKREDAIEIENSYKSLWSGFEILLFTLVGIATNVNYALSKDGLIILGLVFIGLIFRSIGVIISILATKFSKKEKIFIIISYLPKATVQASIGAIALSEGLRVGVVTLTAAVISILFTAPLGAILIDNLYKKLLIKAED